MSRITFLIFVTRPLGDWAGRRKPAALPPGLPPQTPSGAPWASSPRPCPRRSPAEKPVPHTLSRPAAPHLRVPNPTRHPLQKEARTPIQTGWEAVPVPPGSAAGGCAALHLTVQAWQVGATVHPWAAPGSQGSGPGVAGASPQCPREDQVSQGPCGQPEGSQEAWGGGRWRPRGVREHIS